VEQKLFGGITVEEFLFLRKITNTV